MRETIVLNKTLVTITVSLERALRQLVARGTKRVWADAVCINQGDLQERASQVQLMTKIYAKADEVVCYIGESSNLSSQVFNIVDSSRLNTANLGPGVDDVTGRAYWRKAWIVQEIVAGTSVKVRCGNEELRWEVFSNCELFRANPFIMAINRLYNSYRYPERGMERREPSQLLLALSLCRSFEATDLRDKLFSLLGICADGGILLPTPNYIQPLEDLLTDFTRSVICKAGMLSVLGSRGSYRKGRKTIEIDANIPSWAQDWLGVWTDADAVRTLLSIHAWRLAKYSPISQWPSRDSTILDIKAISIGCITQLARFSSPSACSNTTFLEKCRSRYDHMQSKYNRVLAPGNKGILTAILSLFQPGMDVDRGLRNYSSPIRLLSELLKQEVPQEVPFFGKAFGKRKLRAGRNALRRLRDLVVLGDSISAWVENAHANFTETVSDSTEEVAFKRLQESLDFLADCVERDVPIIVTDRGYIGLGPPNAQEGDRVCFPGYGLFDRQDVLILRPDMRGGKKVFRVVGEGLICGVDIYWRNFKYFSLV